MVIASFHTDNLRAAYYCGHFVEVEDLYYLEGLVYFVLQEPFLRRLFSVMMEVGYKVTINSFVIEILVLKEVFNMSLIKEDSNFCYNQFDL